MLPANLTSCNGDRILINRYARRQAGDNSGTTREIVNRRANLIVGIWDHWSHDICEDNAFNRLFVNFFGSPVKWTTTEELCHLARKHHGPQDFQQIFQYFEDLLWNKAVNENKSWEEILCLTTKEIKVALNDVFTAAFWANPPALQPRRPTRLLRQRANAGPPLPIATSTNATGATSAQTAANASSSTNATGSTGAQTAANTPANVTTTGSTGLQTGTNISPVVNTGTLDLSTIDPALLHSTIVPTSAIGIPVAPNNVHPGYSQSTENHNSSISRLVQTAQSSNPSAPGSARPFGGQQLALSAYGTQSASPLSSASGAIQGLQPNSSMAEVLQRLGTLQQDYQRLLKSAAIHERKINDLEKSDKRKDQEIKELKSELIRVTKELSTTATRSSLQVDTQGSAELQDIQMHTEEPQVPVSMLDHASFDALLNAIPIGVTLEEFKNRVNEWADNKSVTQIEHKAEQQRLTESRTFRSHISKRTAILSRVPGQWHPPTPVQPKLPSSLAELPVKCTYIDMEPQEDARQDLPVTLADMRQRAAEGSQKFGFAVVMQSSVEDTVVRNSRRITTLSSLHPGVGHVPEGERQCYDL